MTDDHIVEVLSRLQWAVSSLEKRRIERPAGLLMGIEMLEGYLSEREWCEQCEGTGVYQWYEQDEGPECRSCRGTGYAPVVVPVAVEGEPWC